MAWVRALADALAKSGKVRVLIDQSDLSPGMDVTRFMEQALQADRTVIILTPPYAEKATRRTGGVGYENLLITAQLYEAASEDRFIPVLRGDPQLSVPAYLKTRLYLDMRDDRDFDENILKLLKTLQGPNASGRTTGRPNPATAMGTLDRHSSPTNWRSTDSRSPREYERSSLSLQIEQQLFAYRDHHFVGVPENKYFWSEGSASVRNGMLHSWFYHKKMCPTVVRCLVLLQGAHISSCVLRTTCEIHPLHAIPMIFGAVYREQMRTSWLLTSLRDSWEPEPSFLRLERQPSITLLDFALVTRLRSPLRRRAGSVSVHARVTGEGFPVLEAEWTLPSVW
jgi:hypothetical protein